MTLSSTDIRELFLNYFHRLGHTIVPSSPLVPGNDPTLLFTNAGMVQFKDIFLGLEKRPYSRATSSQRCVRAGGKHNDLENVGYTARHHTFFEMLGNFSFGDYFKEQAINYAWSFLTQELKISEDKLWVTVFENDDEAENIWINKVKVDPKRLTRCGAKDNFWSMGDTGPCGPCTEIYYDHGPNIPGGPPGHSDAEGDRFIEIWNLVFMQFDRQADGTLLSLPKPSVDTGMGLERIAAVMQGVHSNYEIDIFQHLIRATAEIASTKNFTLPSLRVLADHIRSTAFLILDGITPSNEGRGYVLRRIIRRAIRHGKKIGMPSPSFYQLVLPLVEMMGGAYPELKKAQTFIEKVLLQEEQQFSQTLEQGLKILSHEISKLNGEAILPGKVAFRLYDTYGFPIDLTADIAREHGLVLDEEAFAAEMAKQRQLSHESQKFSGAYLNTIAAELQKQSETLFIGYENLTAEASIVKLLKNDADEITGIILNCTPFYAESGGQIGDQGIIKTDTGLFEVNDVQKLGQHVIHYGKIIQGVLSEDQPTFAGVNTDKRLATAANHSATHLLHAALRKILGEHVVQRGSLVTAERLRFDFTHSSPVTIEEQELIENLVNQQIRANYKVNIQLMSPEKAIAGGAMALFGEKYTDEVRVLSMGNFSQELCGGTHVLHTGDIGLFKIINETGIASGIRRIEAVTGVGAQLWIRQIEIQLRTAANLLKTPYETVTLKVQQLLDQQHQLQKQIEQMQSKLASSLGDTLLDQARLINGVNVLTAILENANGKVLREVLDQLKQKLPSAVIVLGASHDSKVDLIAGVTKDLVNHFQADQLIKAIAIHIGGKGGGRADMAQAGGNHPEKLSFALSQVEKWITNISNPEKKVV